jgi:hypothetical protein
MKKIFKSVLPVDLPFCLAGQTIEVDCDKNGTPVKKEIRKRAIDGGLIEVKIATQELERKSKVKGNENE